MNNKQDKTVYTYLNSIDFGPLLTKDQEGTLIENIEVYQKEILTQVVVSKYSRTELKSYLQGLESSGESVVDISKKLHDESPKDEINHIKGKFDLLIKELQGESNVEVLNKLLAEVSLTGTIIHGIVTEIKKKHSLVSDVESKFKAVRKYFTNETDDVIVTQIRTSDPVLHSRLKMECKINDIRASNKISEFDQVLNDRDEAQKVLSGFTFEEVKEIYKKIAGFEMQASKFKNELITRNLRLVVSRAKKFMNKGLEFEDLIQEGNIGLMKAVDKFDSSKKTKVSTYATWWIDQSIRRAISNKGKTVRVPTHIEWMQTNIDKAVQKLTATLKRPPSLKEISEASGIELSVLEDLQTRAKHQVGLEEELASGKSLIDILPSDPAESPFTIVEGKMLREKIREILATLPPRTEKIIRLRFGIGEVPDDEGTTLQAIADQVGITKQGVRVVECSAFKQLKKKARKLVNE